MDYENKFMTTRDNVSEEGSDDITIKIKDIQGDELELKVKKTDKVSEISKKYRQQNDVNDHAQILLHYGGQPMKEDKTLKELNVQDGDTIHYTIRLRGGKN